jgi:PEP-CTERM motif
MAFVTVAALTLAMGSAKAVVVTEPFVTLDISGAYKTLPSSPTTPDAFVGKPFDFSIELPTSMPVKYNANTGNYRYTTSVSGTYTDSGKNSSFSQSFADAIVTFNPSGKVDKVTGETIDIRVAPFATGFTDDVFTISIGDSTDSLWSVSNPGGKGILTLADGTYKLDGSTIGASANYTAGTAVGDPVIVGRLYIPEPSSLALSASGLLGLLFVARRRTRA